MFPNDSINIRAAIMLVDPINFKRFSIGANERLAVTLRYCITGDAQTTGGALLLPVIE